MSIVLHKILDKNDKPFKCEFCTKAFVNKDKLFKHCKTISHIERTNIPNPLPKASTIWNKYILKIKPTEHEREFLYKFFQRNWDTFVTDQQIHRQIECDELPDYQYEHPLSILNAEMDSLKIN